MNNDITKKMLSVIREGVEKSKTYKVKPLEEESKPVVRENILTEWKRLDKTDILKKKVIKEEVDVDTVDIEAPKGKKFTISKSTRYTGVPLKNLKIKRNYLLACIIRNNKVIIPTGSDTLEPSDSVVIITTDTEVMDVSDILE